MKEYLRVQSGPFHLLLDATRILEILELDTDELDGPSEEFTKAGEHLSWREQMLKLLDWREILGLESADNINFHIVYQLSDTEQPIIYAIERINGLLHLDNSDFLQLPPLPEKLTDLFDKAYYDSKQQIQIMRLRTDVSLQTIESYLIEQIPNHHNPIPEPENAENH